MDSAKASIRTYFAKLGLEHEIADLYLALHIHGPQSISELSRNSGVERTRIYRLIDQLMESSLIEVETQYKRGIIKAAPIANLHILISQKEQELKSLQDELGLIEQTLARNSLSSPASRVQFYQGAEGVKQMFWNQTRSKTEMLSLLHENMQIKTKGKFFERWVEKCNEQNLRSRSIFGESFIDSQNEWYANNSNKRMKNWEGRFISKDTFAITHGMVIYDNVVAYYNWQDGEIFGVEIYNQEVADTQRQFFEVVWEKAKPKTDI